MNERERFDRALARFVLTGRRLCHGHRDEENVPVTIHTLQAACSSLEVALAALELAELPVPPEMRQ